ncbi:hypothetical protein BO83DRAFT_388802 [Aspergillus eucalypticola CBS 122712]|uniref:Uncharacterized protein n=1 Tax=Aspergillus eucalypticola (strain CBS 122712 / IBT 29274) TaxID=1448314 RepID=A0A317VJL8_ASPEC|nr:uncharacterized protein BO83DRAFT_388802 [Aspergillus eucalypticola CBS 122712]PWY73441.1 hypothetical protein BO83DRAFT_388802 [Aspergillus eucalypticola CBS 122712]
MYDNEYIIPRPEESQWAKNIDMLLEGSTCWQYLVKLIRGLRTEEGTNALQKLVVLSEFPSSAVVLYLLTPVESNKANDIGDNLASIPECASVVSRHPDTPVLWSPALAQLIGQTQRNLDLIGTVSELEDLTSTHPVVTLNSNTCYITSQDENVAVSYDGRDNPTLSTQPASYAVAVRKSPPDGLGILRDLLSGTWECFRPSPHHFRYTRQIAPICER